jgi:hypothetical protein
MPSPSDEQSQLELLQEAICVRFTDIVHRDKPDFLVRYAGQLTGIELTDGSSEAFRRALTIQEKEGLPSYTASGFSDHEDKRVSGPELLCKLTTSEFTSSEDKAVAFAERIVARIKHKRDLFKKILSDSLLFHDFRGRLAIWGVASLVRPDVPRRFPIGPQSRSYSESDDVPIFGICIVLAVRGFQRQIQKCGGAHRCAVSRWVGDRTNPQFRCRWATIVAVARLPVRRTHSGS